MLRVEFGRVQDSESENDRVSRAGIAGVMEKEKYTVFEVGIFQESIRTIDSGLL